VVYLTPSAAVLSASIAAASDKRFSFSDGFGIGQSSKLNRQVKWDIGPHFYNGSSTSKRSAPEGMRPLNSS
jgi:hypothetical protein